MSEKAMVLFSGGVDSTTCLGLAIEKYGVQNVIPLSVQYGQKHEKEVEAARRILEYYGIEGMELDFTPIFAYSDCSLLLIPKRRFQRLLMQNSSGKMRGFRSLHTYRFAMGCFWPAPRVSHCRENVLVSIMELTGMMPREVHIRTVARAFLKV